MKLSDFNTLAEAKLYSTTTGALINRDSLNGWLGSAGIYKRMKAIAADDTSPFCDVLEAFLDSVDYNFIQGTTTGDAHIALLDSLISGEPTIGPQLAALKPLVMARANVASFPFANATQHDFQLAKGTINRIQKQEVNGWLKITTNADTEPHKPQIYVDIQGVKQRINGFGVVSVAGEYLAKVERGYATYYVDNAYGVVS